MSDEELSNHDNAAWFLHFLDIWLEDNLKNLWVRGKTAIYSSKKKLTIRLTIHFQPKEDVD